MNILLIDGQYILSSMHKKLCSENNGIADESAIISQVIDYVKKKTSTRAYTHCLFCLDDQSRSARRDIYQRYKENRTIFSQAFFAKLPKLIIGLRSIGVKCQSASGFESVDVIASIIRKLSERESASITAISNDARLHPYITENVIMESAAIFNSKITRLSLSDLSREYSGVGREQFRSVLSLVGDAKKGIPGLSRVGIKKACKLVNKYKTIRDLINDQDVISSLSGSEDPDVVSKNIMISDMLTRLHGKLSIGISLADMRLAV